MAHTHCNSLFGLVSKSKLATPLFPPGGASRSTAMVLLAMVFAAISSISAAAQTSSYVPIVVSSSVSPVPTTTYPLPLTGTQTNLKQPSYVSVDACGNIYTIDHGYDGNAPITRVPAGGGAASVAYTVGNSYGVTTGQDAARANLLVSNNYGTSVAKIPLVGCVPQSSNLRSVGGGNGALYYYYDPGTSTGDFAGNTYISTNGTCCVTGSYYLVQEVNGSGNILLANVANEITSIAVDQLQNVYFIMASVVYELPYAGGVYAKTPTLYGSYINPVGVSVDVDGNLYVADSSASVIYEIPNEGAAGPNIKDQFTVSGGININVPVAVNSRGDMYYTAAGASVISELTLGNANFNTVALGQTANRIVNFQFNGSVTVTNIASPTGDFSIQPAALGTTNCVSQPGKGLVAANAYGGGNGERTNCQLTVGFAPQTVGKQSSAVVVTYTQGTTTNTVTAFVEGIGQGAIVTVDPGTLSAAGAGVKSPAGIVVDHAGNTYIADPGNNAVTEYPAGGGAAIPITLGGAPKPATFSAPLGVAVDGAGDVFVADTGNNRVVEIPFVNGALSPAASTVVFGVLDGTVDSTKFTYANGPLKSPSSVYAHTNGDLYIADTGDNIVQVLPHFNGPANPAGSAFSAPFSLGTGLSGPLAVTVDAIGNVFVADSGNNQILGFPLGAGQEIVAADILSPSGLATDVSGALFVVDQGNFRVLRIPSVAGTLNPNAAAEVALGVAAPYGVAIDASSNLYVTDQTNGAAYTIARTQLGLSFGDLAVGTASPALPLTVESAGNLPLIFTTPYFTETGNSGDFAMTSPTGACADGITLAVGATCDLAATFTPTVSGTRSATVTLTSNAVVAPQVTLSGNGVTPAPTKTTLAVVTSATGAPFYGEPLSLTATVVPGGSGTPTGVAAFIVDGVQIGLQPLVKGVATLQLNSGLTGGVHTIYADYKGDTADNASSSTPQTITIARAPTTPTVVVTKVQYNNPYSIRHSNTGSCDVRDYLTYTNVYPAIPNDPVGFLAAVTSPGVGVPSGTLTFLSDGVPINGGAPAAPVLSGATGGSFPANQTVYVLLTLVDSYGETTAGAIASITTTATNNAVSIALAKTYGPATTSVNVYEADAASGAAAPTTFHLVKGYALGATAVINSTPTNKQVPPTSNASTTLLLPASGGVFNGSMSSDANTMGDGTALGENNVIVTPHVITVFYSGDQNYLPSTSAGVTVVVTDVGATTPVSLPPSPVGTAPYCTASSSISGSRPSHPSAFTVAASSTTVTSTAATPGTVSFTISSLGGWVGTVEYACSNLPKYATCSGIPGSVNVTPSTPGVTTLPATMVLSITTNVPPYVPSAIQSSAFLWLPALVIGLLLLSNRRHLRGIKGTRLAAVLIIGFLSGIAGLSGCSSSSGTSTVTTPTGTYPVVVTFTGAQTAAGHNDQGGGLYQEVDQSDLPYPVTVNLTVQ